MSGLFGGEPKIITPPPVPDPPPVPVVSDEAEEFAIREQRKKSGFQDTFLTGSLTPKPTTKKKLLG